MILSNSYLSDIEQAKFTAWHGDKKLAESDFKYDPITDVIGYKIPNGEKFILKANTGYEVDKLAYFSSWKTGDTKTFTKSGNGQNMSITAFENDSTYTFYMGSAKIKGSTTPTDPTTPTTPIKPNAPLNNVYLIDETTAKKIVSEADYRLVNSSSSGGENSGNYTFVDARKGIIGLIQIPFLIDDKLKSDLTTIYYGAYSTDKQGILLIDDKIKINLGAITVQRETNNFTDFNDVECYLYLPYLEPINLDKDYCIGETLEIFYIMSLYDGSIVVNITSTKTGNIIYSKNEKLDVAIPFNGEVIENKDNSGTNIKLNRYNNITTPYLEISKNKSMLIDSQFNAIVIDEKKLADEKGFIEVENIELSFNSTLDEKDRIFNLLRNGVIIK